MRNILMFVLVIMTSSLFVGLTNATAQQTTTTPPAAPAIIPATTTVVGQPCTAAPCDEIELKKLMIKSQVEMANAEATKAQANAYAAAESAKAETEKVRANAYATAEAAKAEVEKVQAQAKAEVEKANIQAKAEVEKAACKKAEVEKAHAALTSKYNYLTGPTVTNVTTAFEAVRSSNVQLKKMGNLKVKVESTIDSPAFVMDWTNPEFDSQLQPYPTKDSIKGKGWPYWAALPVGAVTGCGVWATTFLNSKTAETQAVSVGTTVVSSVALSLLVSLLTN